ncbi:DUF2330 domain-containing protein [Massilia sp. W12]|uniref:DUF2330 domain-containing protein n=1 Tax=Massilia sp. W12 TaxID=3126507 RepID=UPI0030D25A38
MQIQTYLKHLPSAMLLSAILASPAHAFCGFYAGKADASLFNRASQVILARDGERTVISMQNDYQGPLSEFVLVVPTPQAIKQGQVRIADKNVFKRLDEFSTPRLAEYHDEDPCRLENYWGPQMGYNMRMMPAPMAMAGAPMMEKAERAKQLGVTIDAKFTLEEYDILSLSAKQSQGLEIWLRENGYQIPKGASSALAPYIKQGMKFFVAKVNLKEQKKTGFSYLRPLQFAFESPKFMLPMRLGMLNAEAGRAQDLIVYVLTRKGRVEAANYRTKKLPANMNLPFFIKPQFGAFYQDMFEKQAKQDGYRSVFTEYFWDMNWCDPCAADPLSAEELQKAGVFWLSGNAIAGFQSMQAPGAQVKMPPLPQSGQRDAMITRLHLRYTPESFPEDLVLTQTRDNENWQARYVIQQPFSGDMQQCREKAAKVDCAAECKPRVEEVLRVQREEPKILRPEWQQKSRDKLHAECLQSCNESKANGLKNALQYYRVDLPNRLEQEKKTLSDLSGWSLQKIEQMPEAQRYSAAAKK